MSKPVSWTPKLEKLSLTTTGMPTVSTRGSLEPQDWKYLWEVHPLSGYVDNCFDQFMLAEIVVVLEKRHMSRQLETCLTGAGTSDVTEV